MKSLFAIFFPCSYCAVAVPTECFLQDVHRFYNACRIRGAEEDVMGARLALSEATRSVIRTALTVIGVSAPEKM